MQTYKEVGLKMATPSEESVKKAKEAAAKEAVEFIKDGMLVGLGTGSTAAFFIDALIERCRQGLKISAIATSEKSHAQALKGGIPMLDEESVTVLDITVDGADEIDDQKRMIKGGGGALLREKIIASMSKEMVVVVDESKKVPFLGGFPLPIEIVPFAYRGTIHALNEKGFYGRLRGEENKLYLTDSRHYIYDVALKGPLQHPEGLEAVIRPIPGVMTTGFFFGLAGRVVVGRYDGSVKVIT